jgi:hypothetical protein
MAGGILGDTLLVKNLYGSPAGSRGAGRPTHYVPRAGRKAWMSRFPEPVNSSTYGNCGRQRKRLRTKRFVITPRT